MGFMLGRILGINKDVIKEYEDKTVEKIFEDIINQSLKNGWSICKPEWHD